MTRGAGAGSPFDELADDYDVGRPRYPDELFDAVASLSGVGWPGARVVDVGAGTGISSRAMLRRGARVLAVDVGPGMLATLRARDPAPVAVMATGERLPLRENSADLLTYAQAWHWVKSAVAATEAARVLRPGGALALWWNDVTADGERWFEEQQEMLEAWSPGYSRDYRENDYTAGLADAAVFRRIDTWSHRWERRLDFATYERWTRSKSYVAALGDRLEEFIARNRAALQAAFPDGVVCEPFVTRLWVAHP